MIGGVGVQDCLFIVQDIIIEDNQVFIQIEDAKVHVCRGNIQKEEILLMAEILHQLIGSLSHYLQGFIHPRWLFGISAINSRNEKE